MISPRHITFHDGAYRKAGLGTWHDLASVNGADRVKVVFGLVPRRIVAAIVSQRQTFAEVSLFNNGSGHIDLRISLCLTGSKRAEAR